MDEEQFWALIDSIPSNQQILAIHFNNASRVAFGLPDSNGVVSYFNRKDNWNAELRLLRFTDRDTLRTPFEFFKPVATVETVVVGEVGKTGKDYVTRSIAG